MTNIYRLLLIGLIGLTVLLSLKWGSVVGYFVNKNPPPIADSAKESIEGMTPYHSLVPQFTLKNRKGEDFSLESVKGKGVLLNFWASWCAPCREEFPALLSAVKWAKGHLVLVAISNDSSQEDIALFLSELKKAGVKWDKKNVYILWDPEFKVAKQFNVAKWPETFILNQKGQIVKKQAGVFSFQQTKAFLSRLGHP